MFIVFTHTCTMYMQLHTLVSMHVQLAYRYSKVSSSQDVSPVQIHSHVWFVCFAIYTPVLYILVCLLATLATLFPSQLTARLSVPSLCLTVRESLTMGSDIQWVGLVLKPYKCWSWTTAHSSQIKHQSYCSAAKQKYQKCDMILNIRNNTTQEINYATKMRHRIT